MGITAKIRNKAIYKLLKHYKSNEEYGAKLSNGFVPKELEPEYLEYVNEISETEKFQPDTDVDLATFGSYFYVNENKILGKEEAGSGYINPVKTVGNINDLNSIIPFEPIDMGSKKETGKETKKEKTKIDDMPKFKNINLEASKEESAILVRLNNPKKESVKNESGMLSIEESFKMYSPEITDAEVRGYVYFKQKYGSPMFGWEKWFLPTTETRGKLCVAKTTFSLKNQQFQEVKLIPEGTVIGVKTRFSNTYGDDVFWVVKTEQNELYYAKETDFFEKDSYSSVSDDDLRKLVFEKGLCYDGNDYVPVFMFTYGDIYDIKSKFEGKYNADTYKHESGLKEDLIERFDADVAKWHEDLIMNVYQKKTNFDFSNPIVSERPYLSKENDLSRSIMVKELSVDSGVNLKKHFDDMDSQKRRYSSRLNWIDGENSIELFEAFKIWFSYNVTDLMLEKTTVADIKKLYFEREGRVSMSDEETEGMAKKDIEKLKDEKKILAKIEGEKWYSEFLATALSKETLIVLNISFNKKFNSFSGYDLSKVPVAFEANGNVFNLPDFRLNNAQRNGLAFMNINNGGCLAYDVGFGKGHLMTSKILTPDGYCEMKDLGLGSKVIGKDGMPTVVSGIYPLGKVQCYKVVFSDGSYTEVSDEHLWNVQTINYRSKYPEKWDTVQTKDIIDSLYNYRGDYNYSIPMAEPVEFAEKELPIHPYVIGFLLGDGCLSGESISFSNPEKDLQEKVSLLLPNSVHLVHKFKDTDYSISRKAKSGKNEMLDMLRDFNLIGTKSNTKFVPDVYKINSTNNRLELLRGLLDSDGYIQKGNHKNGCSVQYSTASKQLSEDIKFLVQSFGGTVVISTKNPYYTYNGERKSGQLAYILTIRLPKGIIPVSSEKHLSHFVEKTKYQPVRFIQAIEDIGFHEAQCIKVEAEDHLYLCNEFIVTHNTLTAIHNLAIQLKQGSIKRPLIVVPKQVYKNWIFELFGYWTDGEEKSQTEVAGSYFVNGALSGTKYKLNNWYNLRGNYEQKNVQVAENTITLITYQGLEMIGFSEKLNADMSDEFYKILSQEGKDKTDREVEKEKEKRETKLGKALKKTEYDIDVLGFDYLTFDEAHAFKNIFSVIEIPKEFANSWRLSGGTESYRAIKAFVLSLYVQKKYNGNVALLTATPFTNSPLELYSMLSLVAYNYLASSSLNNLFNFLSLFIETEVEYTVDHLQNIVLNTVIKSFKNKNILRDVLYRYFDYQDDPELAGVKRPCKLNIPNKKTSSYLTMSDTQIEAQEAIKLEAASYDPKYNRGAMGRALSWAKSNSFSPYLLPTIEKYADLEEFIQESPKLNYTIQCIKTVKEYHESRNEECSGQVIYSNRGKDLFEDFKKALINECGFQTKIQYGEDLLDEVEIITGGEGESSGDRKELVKDAFNNGIVKVIIGTATIQEGINLQKRGTVLYNLDLDWNPTSFKQLEGRIYRQGNKFKFVRIVVPMIQNSLDSFINQKLDEKTKRIASIWDKKNKVNTYDLNEALDPMEIKFNLITDETKLVAMRLDMDLAKAKKELLVAEDKFNTFEKLSVAVDGFKFELNDVLQEASTTANNMNTYLNYINRFMQEKMSDAERESNAEELTKLMEKLHDTMSIYSKFLAEKNYRTLADFRRALRARSHQTDIKMNGDFVTITYEKLKRLFENLSSYSYFKIYAFSDWMFDRFMGYYADCKKYEKLLLLSYGMTFLDDYSDIKNEYKSNFESNKERIEFLNSPDYKDKIFSEVRAELDRRQGEVGSLEDRVVEFAKSNTLLSYPFDEKTAELCDMPEMENTDAINYMREQLSVEEYLDFESDDIAITNKKLNKIKDFLSKDQYKTVRKGIKDFAEPINRLYKTIASIPAIGDPEKIETEDKLAMLHYYVGGSDFFILETEKVDVFDEDDAIQSRSFGWAILNQDYEMAELGYIDLNEIKKYAELDFHFYPKPLKEVIDSFNPYLIAEEKQKVEAFEEQQKAEKEEESKVLESQINEYDTKTESSEAIEWKATIKDLQDLIIEFPENESNAEFEATIADLQDLIKELSLAYANGGSVWSHEQQKKVKALDSEFEQYLKSKGVDAYSKEASNEWRSAGFRDRFKNIFSIEENQLSLGGSISPEEIDLLSSGDVVDFATNKFDASSKLEKWKRWAEINGSTKSFEKFFVARADYEIRVK